MKNSAMYSKLVKRFFNRLKRGPRPTWHNSENPMEQLILAVLTEGNSPTRARTALSRILNRIVDYNDLRVSTPEELARLVQGDLPNALDRTRVLVRILNAIYEKENCVNLENAKSRSKRETLAYLEQLDGMTPFVAASTMLWGFGEHMIPVDHPSLDVLKKEGVVDRDTALTEAQSFLKRQINASDARLFAALLKRHTSQRTPRNAAPTAKRKRRKKRARR